MKVSRKWNGKYKTNKVRNEMKWKWKLTERKCRTGKWNLNEMKIAKQIEIDKWGVKNLKFGKCELIFGIARLILEPLSYLAVIQFATLRDTKRHSWRENLKDQTQAVYIIVQASILVQWKCECLST